MTLFSRIIIIGVGLMGGSLGLACKRRGLAEQIIGIDCETKNLRTALDLGLIDVAATGIEEVLNENACSSDGNVNELFVVATPVGKIVTTIREIARVAKNSGRRRVLITDLGSAKEGICSELAVNRLPSNCRHIGSHPIAGSERSGPEHADALLYENSPVVLTPIESDREVDIAVLVRFWQKLGSRVYFLEPSEHDRVLARTSHLPHLIGVLLARGLASGDVPFIGPGFRSSTRLAGGEPRLWRDIVSSNRDAILAAIRTHETRLGELRRNLENRDWDHLASILEAARNNRNEFELSVTGR